MRVLEQSAEVQREAVERWFTRQGVPHFADGYGIGNRLVELACLLSTVLAFEVGMAPFLHLSGLGLAFAIALVLASGVLFLPFLTAVNGRGAHDDRRDVFWPVLGVAVIGGAAVVLIGAPVRANAWIDFWVILLGILASVGLSRSAAWLVATRRQRRIVVGGLVAGVALFALDGNAFRLASESESALLPAPSALPALLVAVLPLYWLALQMGHAARATEPATDTELNTGAYIPAVPLLFGVLSTETAVMQPEQVLLPLFALVAIGVLALVAHRRGPGRASTRVERACDELRQRVVSPVAIGVYGAVLVLVYPAILALRGDDGLGGVLAALGVNLFFLLVVLAVVSFGLENVAKWARTALRRTAGGIAQGLVQGLPMLLVACVFFMLAQELWEVVYEAERVEFIALLAILATSAFCLMAFDAWRTVKNRRTFDSWEAVRDDLCAAGDASDDDPVWDRLAGLADSAHRAKRSPPHDHGLKGDEHRNAVAVVLVYQALVFVPVAIAAAFLFWAIGKLAVPAEVAGGWIFGDPSGHAQELHRADILRGREAFDEPWTRVALLLAFFSLLYLAAELLKQKEQHDAFLAGAGTGIRERLAARVVYRDLVLDSAPAPVAAAPRWRRFDRGGRWAARRGRSHRPGAERSADPAR